MKYSNEEKLSIITRYQQGESAIALSNELAIPRSTLYRWFNSFPTDSSGKPLPHFLMSLISLAAPYIDGSNLFQLIVMEAHRHSPSVTTHCSSAKSKIAEYHHNFEIC